MQRPCVCMLVLALALAAFSEASWKPQSQLQDTLSGPGTNRDLEPHQLEQLGPVSHHRRQLGPQGPPRLIELSKKEGPWMEEEEAYGWMDFGRRSAEEGDQHP